MKKKKKKFVRENAELTTPQVFEEHLRLPPYSLLCCLAPAKRRHRLVLMHLRLRERVAFNGSAHLTMLYAVWCPSSYHQQVMQKYGNSLRGRLMNIYQPPDEVDMSLQCSNLIGQNLQPWYKGKYKYGPAMVQSDYRYGSGHTFNQRIILLPSAFSVSVWVLFCQTNCSPSSRITKPTLAASIG